MEDIQTRATTIKRTTENGWLFITQNCYSLHDRQYGIRNDRRWEYKFSLRAQKSLAEPKSLIVDTVRKVDRALSTPSPEVLVVDVSDPSLEVLKLRVAWWTKAPRQHEMIASHDRVLTAIREAMRRGSSRSIRASRRLRYQAPVRDRARQRVRRTARDMSEIRRYRLRSAGLPASVVRLNDASHKRAVPNCLLLITHDLLASFRKKFRPAQVFPPPHVIPIV